MTKHLDRRLFIALVICIPIALGELNGLYNPLLYRTNPALFWVIDVASFVLIPGILVYLLARSANVRPKHYGLSFPPQFAGELLGSSIFFGALLFFLYYVADYIAWAFTWKLSGYQGTEFSYGTTIPNGPLHLPVAIYLSLSAGLMESAFMLGLPWFLWRQYPKLTHRYTLFKWVSSTVFASVHWEQGLHRVIAAFVFGYTACFLYLKINDLWPIVGAHVIVDLVEFF
jgi:hypothetical protein